MNIVCLNCESPLKTGKKFCSRECFHQDRNSKLLTRWLDGENVSESEYELPPSLKRYLLEESGYKCSNPECAVPGGFSGFNQSTGNSILQVDHIDGIAKNNRRNNVRLLCPNCHAMTENYGSLNRGNGRSYRYNKMPQ